MEKRRIALHGNALGLQPEQVLVLETIGSVASFVNVVRRIDGLEWLADQDIDGIPPAHGFEDPKEPDKTLKGQVFLVMTDQQALHEMRRQFTLWKEDDAAPFPSGLAPLKHVFKQLNDIRPWSIEDRIRETDLLEDWADRLTYGIDDVPFEAELWFREDRKDRELAEAELRRVVASSGGEVVGQCVVPEISYHAVLGRLPTVAVNTLAEDHEAFRNIRLLQCEQIMHVRPVGQCTTVPGDDGSAGPADDSARTQRRSPPPLPDGLPIVALFDGMPLAGHNLLDGRIVVDDPDGYEASYQARERQHGTGMASLICHGDLDEERVSLTSPVYVRPLMQPRRGYEQQFVEEIPEHVLPVDLFHRAVRRLFESEGDEAPSAPSVRVIVLAVGDRARPFLREMSPWARLLDWLAWKYRILFIVSAGNHLQPIQLDVPRAELQQLTDEDRGQAILKAVTADTRNRRLLSPAETINGLTVGALHKDSSKPASGRLVDPYPVSSGGMPSVTTAHGPGYRLSIKPDILLPGGVQCVLEKLGTAHSHAIFEVARFRAPPGQRVAAPGDSGDLDNTAYTRGTSNATALAARAGESLYRMIARLGGGMDESVPEECDVVLTKALLAHGATWGDAKGEYATALRGDGSAQAPRKVVGHFVGYGAVNLARVQSCAPERVTVLGFGELDAGEGALFHLPLPPSLSGVERRRRLTITLAWLSPISCSHKAYRVAHLWFNPANEIAGQRLFADHRAAQNGTVQHEVLEGRGVADFDDGDNIVIKVNCRRGAGRDIEAAVPYGLVVTLEVMGELQQGVFPVPIYEEVRDRLAIRVPIGVTRESE